LAGKKKITYKKAGVDISKANRLIRRTKQLIDSTRRAGSMDSIGGFGAFFDIKKTGIKDPVLVSSTDGVGTKLKIAIETGTHSTVGVDLVAMCVNDCLCSGAKPLFFLDYFATGKLEGRTWEQVVKGIVKGCKESGCALIGGETAEMPGMYKKGEYDLAGFTVGAVSRNKIVDGSRIKAGDSILGIQSSGLHSNGFSLVRKIFSRAEIRSKKTLFLRPTTIYVRPVLDILERITVKGIANITGGGFYDNIPRILPERARAVVYKESWRKPEIFEMIKRKANIDENELYRTFNMGIGMVLVMPPGYLKKTQKLLKDRYSLKSYTIGEIVKGKKGIDLI